MEYQNVRNAGISYRQCRRLQYRDAKPQFVLNTASQLARNGLDLEFKCLHQMLETCLPGMCEDTEMILKTRTRRYKSYNPFSHNIYTPEPGYIDIRLYNTSLIASDIPW
jgi:hypothetical protein